MKNVAQWKYWPIGLSQPHFLSSQLAILIKVVKIALQSLAKYNGTFEEVRVIVFLAQLLPCHFPSCFVKALSCNMTSMILTTRVISRLLQAPFRMSQLVQTNTVNFVYLQTASLEPCTPLI